MNKVLWSAFLLCITLAPQLFAATTPPPSDEQELKRITAELMDAVAPGEWEVWDRYLDDRAFITDENGNIMSKEELHASFKPLPPGYSGSIEIAKFRAVFHGDTAIVLHEDFERENVLGHPIEAHYRLTDTYIREKDGWRMVASQVFVVPTDPAAASVDPKVYDKYVGVYELTPTVTYTITREANKLFGQRTGRDKQELLPEADSVFFISGEPRSRRVFTSDASGRVIELRDRRDGRDLIWTRKN
jgi:hypothetical protein